MNSKPALALLASVVILASCGQGSTTVTGFYGENAAPDSIRVILPENNQTLAFPVENGQFTAKIPTSKTHPATVEGIYLIPDGNKMSIDFTGVAPVLDTKSSEINARVQAFLSEEKGLLEERNEFMTAYQKKIDRQELVEESFYQTYYDVENRLEDLCRKTIEENSDNDLAVQALKRIYLDLTDAELNELLAKFSPELMESNFVSVLSAVMEKRATTAVGQKFKDFTVTYTDGSPEEKFSDYVGKGKFILVDYWASWCGPCRAELPYLKMAYKKFKGDKFDILGVAVWDRIVNTKEAIAELSIPWHTILGSDEIAAEAYGINSIPCIMLFGPDGTILRRDLRGEEIEKAIQEEMSK